MVTAWGVDYAFPPIPRPSVLAAVTNPDNSKGKDFVVRYGGKGTTDKMLTASELSGLRAHGIDVVANTEGSAGGFRGYAAGQDWARAGRDWFDNLGRPPGRPIYFSADWDVQEGDWPDLKAALDGAASVIGRSCVGLYGGLYAIQQAQGHGSATWFWQTYAWSTRNGNTVWASGTHMQQYRNKVTIDGADCDLNRALTADYGQWGFQGETMDEQSIITALYNDLHRNPGDPAGQSGLNKLFRQFVREETANDLKPIASSLQAVAADLGVVKADVASGVSVDPAALAAALETAVGKAVADIAAKINPAA